MAPARGCPPIAGPRAGAASPAGTAGGAFDGAERLLGGVGPLPKLQAGQPGLHDHDTHPVGDDVMQLPGNPDPFLGHGQPCLGVAVALHRLQGAGKLLILTAPAPHQPSDRPGGRGDDRPEHQVSGEVERSHVCRHGGQQRDWHQQGEPVARGARPCRCGVEREEEGEQPAEKADGAVEYGARQGDRRGNPDRRRERGRPAPAHGHDRQQDQERVDGEGQSSLEKVRARDAQLDLGHDGERRCDRDIGPTRPEPPHWPDRQPSHDRRYAVGVAPPILLTSGPTSVERLARSERLDRSAGTGPAPNLEDINQEHLDLEGFVMRTSQRTPSSSSTEPSPSTAPSPVPSRTRLAGLAGICAGAGSSSDTC